MQKIFAKKLKNDTFSFYEDDEYHLLKVLQIKLNQEIICIYDEKKYLCKIIKLNPLLAQIINEIPNIKINYSITLFQAVIKPKCFEEVIANCTQMNVDNIIPILFSRSQYNLKNNISRMNNIIKSNSSIANRNDYLKINSPILFKELPNLLNQFQTVIIPYENNENYYLTQSDILNNNIAIIIGPEGGFSSEEINCLSNLKNVKFIKLTPTILKSETAALYTVSIVSNFILNSIKENND